MENLNQKIADALNSVSGLDVFSLRMGRILRKQMGCDPVEMPTTEAIEVLETRIRAQAVKLNQAKEVLREIREAALDEAKEAVLQASGD